MRHPAKQISAPKVCTQRLCNRHIRRQTIRSVQAVAIGSDPRTLAGKRTSSTSAPDVCATAEIEGRWVRSVRASQRGGNRMQHPRGFDVMVAVVADRLPIRFVDVGERAASSTRPLDGGLHQRSARHPEIGSEIEPEMDCPPFVPVRKADGEVSASPPAHPRSPASASSKTCRACAVTSRELEEGLGTRVPMPACSQSPGIDETRSGQRRVVAAWRIRSTYGVPPATVIAGRRRSRATGGPSLIGSRARRCRSTARQPQQRTVQARQHDGHSNECKCVPGISEGRARAVRLRRSSEDRRRVGC